MRIVMIVSWLGDDCTSCRAGNEVVPAAIQLTNASVPFFCHKVNPYLGGLGLVSNCATFVYGVGNPNQQIGGFFTQGYLVDLSTLDVFIFIMRPKAIFHLSE